MTQRFEDPIPVEERLTEEEVQSIVKRYGEGQAGGDPRATVADVAEALQVEPAVVTRLLRDIRTADSEKQLKERLESLEKENAELKRRADDSDYGYGDFYSSMHWSGRRPLRRRRRSVAPQTRSPVARSARHCTPSRKKNRSVSTTAWVGQRGRP